MDGGGGGGGGDQGGMNSLLSHSLDVDHHHHHGGGGGGGGGGHFHEQSPNDFFEQILSSAIPNWPPSDLSKSAGDDANHDDQDGGGGGDGRFQYGGGGKSPATAMQLLQQQLHSAMMPGLPLSLATADADSGHPSPFKSQGAGEAAVQALFNGFAGSLPGQPPPAFHPGAGGAAQNYGGSGAGMNQPSPAPPPPSASTGGSSGTAGTGTTASQKQNKPRARRGQATDPHSIAERLRRERIAERMKALQELVPNANKTDKASMLDEIIDYVKFLQLQVKVLSMSRLGGAGAVAPLVADMSSEGGGAGRMSNNAGNQPGAGSGSGNESSMTVTEHQVAKLMEEDMGSAMQYLQGKGLCLMPISLATAISTATCHSSRSNNPLPPPATALGRALLGNNGNHDNGGANHPPPVPSNSTAPVEAPTSPTASRD